MTIEVGTDGYSSWKTLVMEKPTELSFAVDTSLVRLSAGIKLDSSNVLVAFDKLLAEFPKDKVVGSLPGDEGDTEEFTWEVDQRVATEEFANSFKRILDDHGFLTDAGPRLELFKDTPSRDGSLPRFTVGAELMDYYFNGVKADGPDLGRGKYVSRTYMSVRWKVLDNATDKVVLERVTEGVARYRDKKEFMLGQNLLAFEDALENFIGEGAFMELVERSEPLDRDLRVDNDEEVIPVKGVVPDASSTVGERIRNCSRSSATIITDAGHGSGVVIDDEGLVLTAYHVVAGVNRVDVKFENGVTQRASLVRMDKLSDLALLKIVGEGYPVVHINMEVPLLGEDVMTIGTPASPDLGQSVSKGVVSGLRLLHDYKYIQTDVAVSPGNSGGPLFDQSGSLIGIIQSKLVGEGVEGIGFALPIGTVFKELHLDYTPAVR